MQHIIIEPILSESNLRDVLEQIFKVNVQSQTKIRNSQVNTTYRVNYSLTMPHNNQLLLVKFNKSRSYTHSNTIIRDYGLRFHCELDKNIRLVEIPYFVQLNNHTIAEYFGDDVYDYYVKNQLEITTPNPSGFISNNMVLPYDFCPMGVIRYHHDTNPFCSKVISGCDDQGEYTGTCKEIYESLLDHNNFYLLDIMVDVVDDYESHLSIVEQFKHYPT